MEEMRSPQSESLRNEGYENLSIGSLIQNSVATLEHECATLEQDIEEKSQGLQELKNMCAKQEENISKQRLELEHIKIKTYTEVMNREAFLANSYLPSARVYLQFRNSLKECKGSFTNQLLRGVLKFSFVLLLTSSASRLLSILPTYDGFFHAQWWNVMAMNV
ncbi:hypothetical protein J6590_015954 [Homalodisca vitripennis]|nr:hypothetical protein J6590_015954 [Homalodisca vitripennis]